MIRTDRPWVIDYVGNFWNARDMARRIQDYWHKRGHYHVKVWVVKDEHIAPYPVYLTKSNIKFTDWENDAHMWRDDE